MAVSNVLQSGRKEGGEAGSSCRGQGTVETDPVSFSSEQLLLFSLLLYVLECLLACCACVQIAISLYFFLTPLGSTNGLCSYLTIPHKATRFNLSSPSLLLTLLSSTPSRPVCSGLVSFVAGHAWHCGIALDVDAGTGRETRLPCVKRSGLAAR